MQQIAVRFGELHIPQDFIAIDSNVCQAVSAVMGLPEDEAVYRLWDLVCGIKYPPDDFHSLEAFTLADLPFLGRICLIERSSEEFFQFPSETLTWGYGDCDDTSILLCALLRGYGIGPERVKVVVGEIPQGGHCWVALDGHILETTLSSAPNPAWRNYPEYVPAWSFNDIMQEGEIVFVPKGDEREKLREIGALWGHPTKVLT